MNFFLLIPEFTVLATLLVLLIREVVVGQKSTPQQKLWFVSVGGAFLTLAVLFPLYGKTNSAFSGTFVLDPFALFFKTFFVLIVLVLSFLSREFFRGRQEAPGEFLMLFWTSLLGLFFLSSANDFLLMFIALETFTLSLYVMAAYLKKDFSSIESGLKYLIIGSLASAFVIYGISLIFVAVGSTSVIAIRDAFLTNPSNKLVLLGIFLIIAGLGFKVASVPFQLWVPDVYEGAPTPVVAYLSVASKSAGFLLLMRILFMAEGVFLTERTLLFSALAVLTLIYGNLGALLQTNIKRLFGYSSISHAAYLLMGIAVGEMLGISAVLYYLLGYALANLASFMVITHVSKISGNDQMDSFRGLGKRSPFLAGSFFLALLSLAGVPPLAGFFGKFLIFVTLIKANMLILAILGALFVAVSLYYYLYLVRLMYFEAAAVETPIEVPIASKVVIILLSSGIIIAGFWQAPLMSMVEQTAKSLF